MISLKTIGKGISIKFNNLILLTAKNDMKIEVAQKVADEIRKSVDEG